MLKEPFVVLAIAIALGGLLSGGVYTSAGGATGIMITNRFTGSSWSCNTTVCIPTTFRERPS